MALILRHCILSQKKRLVQEFLPFHHNVTCNIYINSNIKKFGSILHMKHFSTENDRERIYTGKLTNRIYYTKVVSCTTSLLSLIAQPYIWSITLENDNLTSAAIVLGFLNLFMITTPLHLHFMTRRYITDMFYYPKDDIYVAEVYGIFLKKKQIIFRSNEVDVPYLDSMLKTCVIRRHPVLFFEEDFTDSKYYCILMGYNEPIDFEMGPNTSNIDKVTIEALRAKLNASLQAGYKQIESKKQKSIKEN